MKILVIAPTPFFVDRGCHKRIYEEARVLQDRGHEVIICTYHLGRNLPDMCIVRSLSIPWYKKLEAGPSWHKIYIDLFLLWAVIRTIVKEKPDIIHAHLHEGASLGLICRMLFGIPMIADFQGSLVGELLDHRFIRRNSLPYRFFKFIEQKIHFFTKSMITSSRQAADLIKKTYVFKHERMIPVEDGVDLERFVPCTKRSQDLRKTLGIPLNRKIIIYVGILNSYQGIDYMLEGISEYVRNHDDAHFLIVGFPEAEYLKKAEDLAILSHTTFTGRISYEDIPEYLSLADAGISAKTSETEANGKLLEYMAMGLPLVVFDSYVNKEIVGDLGFYAVMKDSVSLAHAIQKMMSVLQKDHLSLKKNLRKRAEELFSWETKVDVIEALYAKKLSARKK